MLWQEETPKQKPTIFQTVTDLAFEINCRCLPIDHAYSLSQAILQALPWFVSEPLAGLHLIHGAESGNGWQRSEEPDALFYFARRTKLILRLPLQRFKDAQELQGITLDVAGNVLKIGSSKEKPFKEMPVVFARYVVADPKQSEETFLDAAITQMQQMGIQCRKALCGRNHHFRLPDGDLFTRSLMIADLEPQQSITLQQQGLGKWRKMGCGLFVPHKGIGV